MSIEERTAFNTSASAEIWEWVESIRHRRSTPDPSPLLMGILNVTPDSFYDGGKFNRVTQGVEQGLRLLEEGADILDIGGESTRPPGKEYGAGSVSVSVQEEIDRVVPVIEAIIAQRSDAVISIDTMKPEVARAAVQSGASLINDVSAGEYDESIWQVAAEADIPCVLMHGHNPGNRVPIDQITYDNVVDEILSYLTARVAKARERGVRKPIIDPGIGFAKGGEDSARIIRELQQFTGLGLPILAGASRKAFIGRILGGAGPEERLYGTLAAHGAAVLNGATILRLHDVRAAADFFNVFTRLLADPLLFTEDFREG